MGGWKKLGERLDGLMFRRAIKRHLKGQSKAISIGRSANSVGYYSNIPIELVEGTQPPQLIGLPFLSTTFKRGNFTKTLYTPSTLHVVVGRDWFRG